jgi:hypothetical protein
MRRAGSTSPARRGAATATRRPGHTGPATDSSELTWGQPHFAEPVTAPASLAVEPMAEALNPNL